MKNVVTLLLASTLILGLVINGCSDEKQQLARKVSVQADSISALGRDLQRQSDSLRVALVKLEVKSAALDSQMLAHTMISGELRDVTARLSEAESSCDRFRDSARTALQQKELSLTGVKTELSDSNATLLSVRAECDSLSAYLAERTRLIGQIKPWYFKWRHDATERNLLERLFGTDKASSPDYPEPDIVMTENPPEASPDRVISVQGESDGK